jgi:hypothetical protein
MSTIKAFSHKVAYIYENNVIQRRVVLSSRGQYAAKDRRDTIRKLYTQTENAVKQNPYATYYIEIKHE